MQYYTIGKLSKLTHISIDTLRYYDEIGLLKPAKVIDDTGYRYYTDESAVVLTRIMEFKEFGFSLNEIKAVLADDGNMDDIYSRQHEILLERRLKLDITIGKLAARLKNRQEAESMNKKVLIVDDAGIMRMMLGSILNKNGYVFIKAVENGAIGVEMYKATQPDIVLMDITMPEMDGITATKKIIEINPNAKIIMVSAAIKRDLIEQSLDAGAVDFIQKPFRTDRLLEAVWKALHGDADMPEPVVSPPETVDPDFAELVQSGKLLEHLKEIGSTKHHGVKEFEDEHNWLGERDDDALTQDDIDKIVMAR